MSELDARLAEPDRAWRARLHPNWVNPPDPLPVLVEAEDLASKPPTPFIALHALLVHAANDDVTSLRTVCSVVPDLSEVQAGTLGEVAEGLAALLEGDARLALDHLLEALPGLSALGGSRGQQEVVLETAFAAMMRLGSAGTGRPLLARYHREAAVGVTRGAVS